MSEVLEKRRGKKRRAPGRPPEREGVRMRAVNIVLPPEQLLYFEGLANARGTSRSYEIRRILDAHFEDMIDPDDA